MRALPLFTRPFLRSPSPRRFPRRARARGLWPASRSSRSLQQLIKVYYIMATLPAIQLETGELLLFTPQRNNCSRSRRQPPRACTDNLVPTRAPTPSTCQLRLISSSALSTVLCICATAPEPPRDCGGSNS